jgi:hypothetical protein
VWNARSEGGAFHLAPFDRRPGSLLLGDIRVHRYLLSDPDGNWEHRRDLGGPSLPAPHDQLIEETFVIFIFEVHLKSGYSAEHYASAWVEASKIIQTAPGARGTRLHRKIGDPGVLIAIASWQNKPARDAAESQRDPRVQAILDAQSRFVEIRLVGEFEDPEWIVSPPQREGSPAS